VPGVLPYRMQPVCRLASDPGAPPIFLNFILGKGFRCYFACCPKSLFRDIVSRLCRSQSRPCAEPSHLNAKRQEGSEVLRAVFSFHAFVGSDLPALT
jgi:hypothetical protein